MNKPKSVTYNNRSFRVYADGRVKEAQRILNVTHWTTVSPVKTIQAVRAIADAQV